MEVFALSRNHCNRLHLNAKSRKDIRIHEVTSWCSRALTLPIRRKSYLKDEVPF